MLRYQKLGTDETYSVERRQRFVMETAVPACRPVGARIEREGDAAVATYLDRPRYLWTKTARTLRVMDAVNLNPGSGASFTIGGSDPYTFPVPMAGVLRRIVCRDAPYIDANYQSAFLFNLRIRVRYMTLAGAVVDTIMDGTSSPVIPFDVATYETEVASGATHKIEVACLTPLAAIAPYILNVRFEFALNITTPGA